MLLQLFQIFGKKVGDSLGYFVIGITLLAEERAFKYVVFAAFKCFLLGYREFQVALAYGTAEQFIG